MASSDKQKAKRLVEREAKELFERDIDFKTSKILHNFIKTIANIQRPRIKHWIVEYSDVLRLLKGMNYVGSNEGDQTDSTRE